MIKCNNLHLTLNGHRILQRVSVNVAPGELLAIMGPNGAGKSSLMSLMCGDKKATGGDIHLNGRQLDSFKSKELAHIRAVMPQHSPLSFPFLAWEVVALGRTPYKQQAREQERQMALQQMAMTHTEHLAERAYPSLSGGEKQRVQLARVLNQVLSSSASQTYLFLDECTSSLDPAHQHWVFRLLTQLKAKGIAVVAVVHDINLAAQYCDRVVLLKDGLVIADDTTDKVMSPQLIGQAFGLETVSLVHPEGGWQVIAAANQAVSMA